MGQQPPLPDVGPMAYLVDDLLAMKIVSSGDYGPVPRSWAEILAFSQATGRVQEYWEREVLFDMSWEYAQEYSKANSPFLKSPMERST